MPDRAEHTTCEERRRCDATKDLVEVHVLEQMEVGVRRAPAGEEREAAGRRRLVYMMRGGRKIHHCLATPRDAIVVTLAHHNLRHKLRHTLQ